MVTYFRKVKQTWTRRRKKTLELKQLKRLGFCSNSICRVKTYLPSIFRRCDVKIVKSHIRFFLLLENMCFQVVSILVKTCIVLNVSYTLETFNKSSVSRFITVCKFLDNTLKVLEVIQNFVIEIWPPMAFHGGFSVMTSNLIKPET